MTVMITVSCGWRLKPYLEYQLALVWSEIANHCVSEFDSLGSRLRRGDDGFWHAYAKGKAGIIATVRFKKANERGHVVQYDRMN